MNGTPDERIRLLIEACEQNPWLNSNEYSRSDYDYSFRTSDTLEDLVSQFKGGNWAIRSGFLYENLAFVQQVNGGDEYLALSFSNGKWSTFESISFGMMQENSGLDYVIRYLEKLVKEYAPLPMEHKTPNELGIGNSTSAKVHSTSGKDTDATPKEPLVSRYSPEEKQYDIGMGHLGNGLTVWNKAVEIDGDYETIAHINVDRTIKFYDKDLPKDVKKSIELTAATSTATISAMQDTPIFTTPPKKIGRNQPKEESNRRKNNRDER